MPKSKLINSGSYGCVFYPKIPCEKEKKHKKKKSKRASKRASKLILIDDSLYDEYKINKIIKKIKNHEQWTAIWDEKCLSPKYNKLKKISQINKCIDPKKQKILKYEKLSSSTKFTLLQGYYGGKRASKYMENNFKSHIYHSKKQFIQKFIEFFKMFQSLFIGLREYYNHNICHHDINVRNILFKNNQFIFIDYGLSFITNQPKIVTQRMKKEFKSDRIYESYPYEYLYFPSYKEKEIYEEQEEISLNVSRNQHSEIYLPIHNKLFNRNTDELRFEYLEDKLFYKNKPNLTNLTKSLDTYSLGMLPLILIMDQSSNLNIDINIIISLLKSKQLKSYIDLLKDMTTFHYNDRINPNDAYKRYLQLIK